MWKLAELYVNAHGGVNRRVTQDLGGIRVETTDVEVWPDVHEYVDLNPGIKIQGYHPTVTEDDIPDPTAVPLNRLARYVEGIDSLDILMGLLKKDPRKGSKDIYHQRITELLDEFGSPDAE
jgi:hypothetical protein